ncbi:MAG: imidazolonepropionase [Flavobacteriales bacterium]|nr:imidazolonepropionase [Flavobacteriales bacterium]
MLIKNIQSLLQTSDASKVLRGDSMKQISSIENAWLLIENDIIKDFGTMSSCPNFLGEIIDATGKIVLPTWCDSHTHLVFATSREEEFEMRLKGKSYQEIAEAGGGILNSAKKLQNTSEADLFDSAWSRLNEVIRMGTGAIEIKSGYGLSVDGELKMLRVIKCLKERSPIPIKASFLGAHSYPAEFKENHKGYIDLIVNDMLPKIAEEGLADYIDAFCEKVAFSVEETEQIIKAGAKYGLKAKIHTNQFNCMGGIELCVENNALSVDHLEVVNDAEIKYLKDSNTIATLLPSAPFFLSDPYQPGRKLIDEGVAVALASDYNPGSTPSGNMNFVISLACIKLKMTPEEAINAATINGAFAMELEKELGSISKGKKANLILTKPINSVAYLPYSFGKDSIESVIINGKIY